MKKSSFMQGALAVAAVVGTVSAAWATDVGMPLYKGDIAGKKGGIEVYGEHYNQDVVANRGPSGTERIQDVTRYLEQEEDRFILRANYYASPRLALYAEAGSTDASGSKESVALFGAGFRFKVYSNDFFDASVFGSATYMPEAEYRHYNVPTSYGEATAFQEESLSEVNGGLTLSKMIHVSNTFRLLPYGGLMFSKLNGDDDFSYQFTQNQDHSTYLVDGSLKEDGDFSMFAGLGLMFNDTWGLRAEGRFINQTSWSASLTYFF
jgi:hypothetical protein